MKETIDNYLDTSGLFCPEPVMMLHQVVRKLSSGSIVEVTATDPATTRDIPNFCHFLGHELLHKEENAAQFVYTIRLK